MTPFLSFDIETTGTNHKKNSIIQISAEYHVNGEVSKVFNTHLQPDPDKLIDLGALKYNGQTLNSINNAMHSSSKEGLVKFIDWALGINIERNTFILGTNVDFDINFLKQALEDNNISGWESLITYRKRDLTTLSGVLLDTGLINLNGIKSKGTVGKLAEYFGIEIDGKLHDSRVDVQITAQIYYKCLELLKGLNGDTENKN